MNFNKFWESYVEYYEDYTQKDKKKLDQMFLELYRKKLSNRFKTKEKKRQ